MALQHMNQINMIISVLIVSEEGLEREEEQLTGQHLMKIKDINYFSICFIRSGINFGTAKVIPAASKSMMPDLTIKIGDFDDEVVFPFSHHPDT